MTTDAPRAPRPPGGPRRARSVIDPARDAAFSTLRAVDEKDSYANLVLPTLLRERKVDGRDAALATELTYGTLRMTGQLDLILAACSSRPISEVDPQVRDALRLGAYQLLHTRVPQHAAVSSTVDLVRRHAGEGRSKFANAVMRAVSRRSLDEWLVEVAPADAVGRLTVTTSHPRWIVGAFADALGGDLAEAEAALEADNDRPQVHLVARPGRITRDELLAAAGPEAVVGTLSPYAVRLPGGGEPGAITPVRRGRAAVQDEGSQLAAIVLATAPLEGRDEVWLDLAAGPGGKAGLLAGLAAERGAVLVANEVAPHRARLVGRALADAPNAIAIAGDGLAPAWRDRAFDRVLLDAPCSGLGALRRRPEARWRRRPEDLAGLGPLQRRLLDTAIASVRPGGVVGYVTCSPHLAETRAVVSDALKRHPGLEQPDVRPLLAGVDDLGDGPSVQLWPHRHGTDAMFLCLLRVP
ncbi:transcription antitermination factor NusB [Acidothermaceae bacterium B102]|nr:transcription antitermination factor NusB [Acidothermaceae bacterium B102]